MRLNIVQGWERRLDICTGMVCILLNMTPGAGWIERGRGVFRGRNSMLKGGKCIGYHVPATRKRDLFYAKLEREREENQGTV